MTVFTDTSYYIAVLMPRDRWHDKAMSAAHPGALFVTSSLVIDETISLLQSRGLFSTALDFLREIRVNPHVQILYVDAGVQSEAWELFSRHGGSGANAADCADFAIMRRLSIKKAFTFDQHFRAAGFDILR